MAANAKITVTLEVDGAPLKRFVRAVTLDELLTAGPLEYADGGGFIALTGVSDLATQQFVLLDSDQALTMRFDNGAAGDLSLGANSLVVIVNAAQTNQTQISNGSGSTATVKSHVGGT